MTGSNLYPGPLGLCGHCNKKTIIRLGSLAAKSTEPWTASVELIDAIYEIIRKVSSDGGGYVKTAEGKKYKPGRVVVCQRTEACRKHANKGLVTNRLIWISVDGAVGELTNMLLGPFCGICWPAYRRKFESEDGQGRTDFPLYYVITSFENIQLLFVKQEPEKLKKDVPTTNVDDLGTEGLF